jgi:hypothetical protein
MAFRLFFWYENKNYCGGNVKREVSMGLRFENYKKNRNLAFLLAYKTRVLLVFFRFEALKTHK